MEKQHSLSEVFCPLHPSFPIQGVNLDKPNTPSLFCFSCLLEQRDASVKTFSQFLETIAGTVAKSKSFISTGAKPEEYVDVLSSKTKKMEALTKHIEEQKKMIEEDFGCLTKEILSLLHNKKKEYLDELDQQVAKLQKNFMDFELQLKKLYPANDEELASLFPTQESLEKKLKSITYFDELLEFIKDLHQNHLEELQWADLNEKISVQKDRIQRFCQELSKDLRPLYKVNNLDQVEIISQFRTLIARDFDPIKSLSDPIQEFMKEDSGTIITRAEFDTIQNWLPKDKKFNPRLLYQSKRDGLDIKFSEICDGKKETITLAKVLFDGAKEPCVIGGYLDQSWRTDDSWIPSENAFIFSLTSKIKCSLKEKKRAATIYRKSNGVVFGDGEDLKIVVQNKCSLKPKSYEGTQHLVNVKGYEGKNDIFFELLQVEIYSLD